MSERLLFLYIYSHYVGQNTNKLSVGWGGKSGIGIGHIGNVG